MIASLHALSQLLLTSNLMENLSSRLKVSSDGGHPSEAELSKVTLALPVRNEEKNLEALLPQLVAQKFLPKEILILDDESDDGTAEILEAFKDRLPNMRVIQGQPIVSEWRGKVWALHQLLANVKTENVVFMDADVRFRSEAAFGELLSAFQQKGWEFSPADSSGEVEKLGFMSVFPRIEDSFESRLLTQQISMHLYYFLPFFRKYFRMPSAVAGCGQFMLLNCEEFKSLGGFARIRHSTHDGLQLARTYSNSGYPVSWFDGSEVLSVRMYEDFVSAFKGFSRNSFEADAYLPVSLFLSATLFWGFVLPYVLWPFFIANPLWLLSFLYFLYGQKRMGEELGWTADHLLTTPLRSTASVGVHLWGAIQSKFHVKTLWRGRVLR